MIDTSKVLIYNNEFGTVTVVHPAPKYEGTIEDIKAGIGTDRAIDGVIHIIDRSDVPTDRSFRNAWTYTP